MNSTLLTVLAVDDELPQLRDLARILKASSRVGDVDTAATGREAIAKASGGDFDAIFLDVRMPELDGLELARILKAFAKPPVVIFVSAFDTSAVAAFELRAVDYLMKPITPQRVAEALERVVATIRALSGSESIVVSSDKLESRSTVGPDLVAVENVRTGGTRLVPRDSILYLMAYGDYVRIVADSGRYLERGRLTEADRRFQQHGFQRVHRKYVANLLRAVEIRALINGTAVVCFDDGSEIPVSRRRVPELRRRLGK